MGGVGEYRRGEALIVRLELSLEFSARERHVLGVANPGVFIEKHPDPPRVEQQIAEVVSKDFPLIARDLNARGHEVEEGELSEMYVHVELEQDVLCELAASRRPRSYRESPEAEVGLSRVEDFAGS